MRPKKGQFFLYLKHVIISSWIFALTPPLTLPQTHHHLIMIFSGDPPPFTMCVIEDQHMNGSWVLKNSIVEEVEVRNGYDAFVALFEKITKLVGQKVPVLELQYSLIQGDEQILDLLRFHENYLSTFRV